LGSGKETVLEISSLSEKPRRPGGLKKIPGFTPDFPQCTGTSRKGMRRFVKGNAYNNNGYCEEHT
jgi:hypothetical protein